MTLIHDPTYRLSGTPVVLYEPLAAVTTVVLPLTTVSVAVSYGSRSDVPIEVTVQPEPVCVDELCATLRAGVYGLRRLAQAAQARGDTASRTLWTKAGSALDTYLGEYTLAAVVDALEPWEVTPCVAH